MSDLANRIIGHYEKHAAAWDSLRQSCPWNDKIWHDRFVDGLDRARASWTSDAVRGVPWRNT